MQGGGGGSKKLTFPGKKETRKGLSASRKSRKKKGGFEAEIEEVTKKKRIFPTITKCFPTPTQEGSVMNKHKYKGKKKKDTVGRRGGLSNTLKKFTINQQKTKKKPKGGEKDGTPPYREKKNS